jgi:hypothetical protein
VTAPDWYGPAGEIFVLVQYALNTTFDPQGTGRHNLACR